MQAVPQQRLRLESPQQVHHPLQGQKGLRVIQPRKVGSLPRVNIKLDESQQYQILSFRAQSTSQLEGFAVKHIPAERQLKHQKAQQTPNRKNRIRQVDKKEGTSRLLTNLRPSAQSSPFHRIIKQRKRESKRKQKPLRPPLAQIVHLQRPRTNLKQVLPRPEQAKRRPAFLNIKEVLPVMITLPCICFIIQLN